MGAEQAPEPAPPSGAAGDPPKRRPGRPRSAPIEEQRALILTCARRVFAEHDYHGTSIERVAREAGVARQLVYSLYGGKDELFIAVVDDACLRMIEEMTHGLGPETPPHELIQSRVGALFDFINANPELAAIIRIAEYGGFGPAKSEVTVGRRRIEDSLAALFADSWRTGTDLAPEAARMLALITLSLVEAVGFRQPGEPTWDTEQTVGFLTEFLFGAIVHLEVRRTELEQFGRLQQSDR
jgi:AcrR family transcriptional regulator